MNRGILRRLSQQVRKQRKSGKTLWLERLEGRDLLSGVDLTPQLLLTLKSGSLQTVRLDSAANVAAALAAYVASARVQAAEVDTPISIDTIPSDSQIASQWALRNTGQSGGTVDADIDADLAWDVETGSLAVSVAVIDTGIDYTHPDLFKNTWLNQEEVPVSLGLTDTDSDGLITFWDLNEVANSGKVNDANRNGRIDGYDVLRDARWADKQDNDRNGKVDDLVGWDFVNNDNDPFDDNGHGTHVAGTIGAVANNGTGIAGVAWNVLLVGLKFLNASGSGYTSAAINALNYAAAEGIKISNNSWSGAGNSTALANAIRNLRDLGHIVVAAAGNEGSNNDVRASYPANYAYENVVAVAATDRNDRLASFSNYGVSTVDVAAPGVSILSTIPNGGYATYSGTSMATPHVTGAVALLCSANPSLTYTQLISRILTGGDSASSLSGKVASGKRLNVYNALLGVAGTPPGDTTGPRVTSAMPNGSTSASSLRVTLTEAVDALTFTSADVVLSGPQGSINVATVQPVAGSNNTQFDVVFATQTAAGTYSFSIGPDVRDLAGNLMDQDGDGIPGESADVFRASFTIASSSDSTSTFTASPAAPIWDRYVTISTITVDRDLTIADLNVQLNITHTWDADLRITLTSPSGRSVVLVNRRGGSGDDFTNTTLDDEASTAISQGRAPFSGSFRPEYALSAFDGSNARGTWTLRVEDLERGDTGRLNTWSLVVATGGTGAASGSRLAAAIDVSIARMTGGGFSPNSLSAEMLHDLAVSRSAAVASLSSAARRSAGLPSATRSPNRAIELFPYLDRGEIL